MLTKQYLSKHQKSDHFYWITCRDFQSSDVGYGMATAQRYLSFWIFGGEWMHSPKKTEHYKVLSISIQDTVLK